MIKYLVSIFVVTYNQENYISECIDSLLMQETNFDFEIVIGEDNSTDNTRIICESYAKKYVNINLLPMEDNLGLTKNWARTILACNGKYIAMCEGDDYWIDKHKLQLQVDFLESNSDFVMCFTNSYFYHQDSGEKIIAKEIVWDIANTAELIKHNDFLVDTYILPGHTSSILFRNFLIDPFPSWYFEAEVGDLPLFLMLSKFGKAKLINSVTSVYRIHSLNLSNVNFSFEDLYINRIYIYKNLNIFFKKRYNKEFSYLIFKYNTRIFKIYKYKKNIKAIKALFNAIRYYLMSFSNLKML